MNKFNKNTVFMLFVGIIAGISNSKAADFRQGYVAGAPGSPEYMGIPAGYDLVSPEEVKWPPTAPTYDEAMRIKRTLQIKGKQVNDLVEQQNNEKAEGKYRPYSDFNRRREQQIQKLNSEIQHLQNQLAGTESTNF